MPDLVSVYFQNTWLAKVFISLGSRLVAHVELSYIGTVYLLSSTVFLSLFASLADVFGRYSALQPSLIFSFIGSGISTGAVNLAVMLVDRGIAGIGAAGLLTVRIRIAYPE